MLKDSSNNNKKNIFSETSSFAKESLDWIAKNSDLENIIKTTWSIYKTRV